MAEQELKKGDRVRISERSPSHPGAFGTISFVTGQEYWVRVEGSDAMAPALHRWLLEPAAARRRRAPAAAKK